MRAYTELPQVKLMACVKQLAQISTQIQALVEADIRRPMMDQQLLPGTEECCEDIIGAISEFISTMEEIDGFDPTPVHLWDHSAGEQPVSAAERLAADWQQHLALHS